MVAAISSLDVSSAKRHTRHKSKDANTSRSFNISSSAKPIYRSQLSGHNLFGSVVNQQASLESIETDDICLSKQEAIDIEKNLDSYILQPYV